VERHDPIPGEINKLKANFSDLCEVQEKARKEEIALGQSLERDRAITERRGRLREILDKIADLEERGKSPETVDMTPEERTSVSRLCPALQEEQDPERFDNLVLALDELLKRKHVRMQRLEQDLGSKQLDCHKSSAGNCCKNVPNN
jgi:hypothetical protein